MWIHIVFCNHIFSVCSFHLCKHWTFARKSCWKNNTRIKLLGIPETSWCGVLFENLTAFRNQFELPIDCYQSYTTQSEVPSQQHFTWIKTLNAKIWERVDLEDSLIPSIEALWLHWMRSRWVLLSGDKHNVPIFNCHQRSEISNAAKFEFWSKQYKDCFLLSIITCTVYTLIIYVDMFINICFVHLVVW